MYLVLIIGLVFYVQGLRLTTTTSTPVDLNLEYCIKDSNVNPTEVQWLKKGHYDSSSPALKKWAFCYLVKAGIMSSSGVLRQHVVLQNIPEQDQNDVETTINTCLYDKPHDPVETAWRYLMCFRSRLPKYAKDANRI